MYRESFLALDVQIKLLCVLRTNRQGCAALLKCAPEALITFPANYGAIHSFVLPLPDVGLGKAVCFHDHLYPFR